MSGQQKHRIFIAINLPEDVKRELVSYYDKWSELPCRWTKKDNLHITLEFLGDLTDIEMADACNVVRDVAIKHKSFSISLNKILYGPPNKSITTLSVPKMIWVEGEKPQELTDLKEDLQEALVERVSFKPESKSFVLHITLARILEWEFRKFDLEERPEINENIDLVFTAESIEVMESELKKGGPVYTILESHSFE